MHRDPRRWRTRLGRWVEGYTVRVLAPRVGVTPKRIYGWLGGDGVPRDRAIAMVELSRGALTLEDVFRHAAEVRPEPPAAACRPQETLDAARPLR